MTNALFLLFPATALLYFPMAFEEFENPKTFALVSFACFAAFWVKWKIISIDYIAQAFLAFVLSAAASSLLSIDWHMSLFGNVKCPMGLIVIVSYFVFYLAASERLTGKISARKAIDILLWCSAAISIYGIAQALGYDFKSWNGTLKEINYTRPMSFLGHPNFMAGYLAMVLPFGLWRMGELKGKAWFLSIGAIALSVAAIFLSLSRGMIIAAGIGVAVYFIRIKKLREMAYVFALACGVSLIALAVIPDFRATAFHRLPAMITPGPARIEYPKAAARIFRRHPWFGIGTDAFEIGFQQERTPYYWQIERAGSPHRAHNDLLNIAATQGFFGILAAALIFFSTIGESLVSRSEFSAPATAAIATFYVEGLTSFMIVATTIVFLFSVALLRSKES